MDEELPPLQEAFAGLLPEGLGVIGSPPKVGKSLLAYQMGVELVFGGQVLGIPADRRDVLYYALEDGRRRSQQRIRELLNGRKKGLERLDLQWTAPRLGGPLEVEVGRWLDDHEKGVAIIDVLAKVRPTAKAGLNAYDEDYAAIAELHNVCRSHGGSTVLLITHDRKAGSDDWLTRITGTRGVTGAADFVIFINRKRGEPLGKIHVTGRDIADHTYDVEFTMAGWRTVDLSVLIGAASEVRQKIWGWIRDNGPSWQKDVEVGTGLAYRTVANRIADMVKDGQLAQGPKGYSVPDDE
jgi:RecA-family ATPase